VELASRPTREQRSADRTDAPPLGICTEVRDQPGATLGAVTIRAKTLATLVNALCVVGLVTGSVLFASWSTAASEGAPRTAVSSSPTAIQPPPSGAIGSTLASTLLATLPVKPALTMSFVRGVKTSSLVQIDHLVALGDA
jgi:hypothetical protein